VFQKSIACDFGRASLATGVGYRPATVTSAAPLQFLILQVASWIGRRQGEAIEYLRAENRVLRARLGSKRLRFTDSERRLLAQKGKPLGRKLLAEVASLATPETILLEGEMSRANLSGPGSSPASGGRVSRSPARFGAR
jgi:hypothetical protein